MDTSQDLLQEETLVIINFTFFTFTFLQHFFYFSQFFVPTITIPYLFKQCTTDVHYGSLRIYHQAFGGI